MPILLAALLGISMNAFAGTKAWVAPFGNEGGVRIWDFYDNGSDRDANRLFEQLQISGSSSGTNSILKSLVSDDRTFGIDCLYSMNENRSTCAIGFKRGVNTAIEVEKKQFSYRVVGAPAREWCDFFLEPSLAEVHYKTGDGRLSIDCGVGEFTVSYQ